VTLRAVLHARHIAPGSIDNSEAAALPGKVESIGMGGTELQIEALQFVGSGLARASDARGLAMLVRAWDLPRLEYGPAGFVALDVAARAGRAFVTAGRIVEA